MVPNMVKQCDREDYRLLTIDESAANDESMRMVIHAFLSTEHNVDENNIEEIIDQLYEAKDVNNWEICSCDTHVCVLMQGENCMSKILKDGFLEKVEAELSAADDQRVYLKLPM